MTTDTTSRIFPAAALIALLFLLKFAAYAWMVTPLWDIPDESGHYSYVEDMARGQWPVLGQAKMSQDVTHSWKGPGVKPGMNWIAQHPPLFYALDAPSVLLARAAGLDFEGQVRSARMLSSTFGALTILGLALFLARATGRDELGLAGAIFFGATPMFTHLSTGVTHDTLVACTSVWAAWWCVRWLETDIFRYALYAGALAALCTITKLTGLAMALPLFLTMAWHLWRKPERTRIMSRFRRMGTLWLVMFVPVVLWMVRNLWLFQQPFPDTSILRERHLVSIGFFEFMHRFPFWQHTLINFIALIGWNGSDHGALRWIHANGPMARYFLAFLGTTGLAAACMPVVRHLPRIWRGLLIGAGLSMLAFACTQWPLPMLSTWICVILFVAIACQLMIHAGGFVCATRESWLLATAAMCVLFFAFIYYEHLWAIFSGAMRATHGRYLYPVVPFLLLILLWPFRSRVAARLLLCAAVLAMVFADGFFLHQVFPLYGQI